MSIKTLKEMMGMEADSTIVYPLSKIDADALDAIGNIEKYTAAKMVLEHPEINATLKRMNAFDTLNTYSVEPAYEMAQWIVEALDAFYQGIEIEEIFYTDFPFVAEHDELSEFGKEFLAEFTADRAMMEPNGMNAMGDMGDMNSMGDMPDDKGWLDKIAAKFGFHDVGMKELFMLYIMNQMKQNGGREPEGMPMPMQATEGFESEELPTIMEDWVNGVTASAMVQYGSNWEETLYATAWNKYNEGKEVPADEELVEADDATLSNEDDTRTVPKPSAKVKADVAQRIKELSNLIADYKKEQHFYPDIKPAVYNAKESLELIMDFLNAGTLDDYKQAQIHFQKLMSPITNLFPPTLVKFLAYANDGEDSAVLTPVEK